MSNKTPSNDTGSGIANRHSKWKTESDKIRKVQISLDFPDAEDILLRTLAAREHKAPSAMIREILGMPSSPPKRARIGVSFNDDELVELGRRYDVDPANKAEIRRKLTEEVTSVLSKTEIIERIGHAKTAHAKESKSNAMQELQSASDSIHDRFKQALESRASLSKQEDQD